MRQSGSPGGRRRRRRINHHSSSSTGESKRNSSSDLHNRSASISSLNSSIGSTTTNEAADPDGFDVWGSTNSANDFAVVPRQDPHVLVPIETKVRSQLLVLFHPRSCSFLSSSLPTFSFELRRECELRPAHFPTHS